MAHGNVLPNDFPVPEHDQLPAACSTREPVLCSGMFDTLAVAQQRARDGVARDQAEAIAGVIHEAVQQGDSVTADQFWSHSP